MQLGCIALVVGAALTWGGGQGVYEAWNSGKLITQDYEAFAREQPGVGWYKLTAGEWNLADARIVVSKGGDKPTGEMYVPVHKPGVDPNNEKARVILHRFNAAEAEDIERSIEAQKQGKEPDQSAMQRMLAPHPVQGMIEFGINSDDKDIDQLKEVMAGKLADQFVVIADGETPPGYGGNLIALIAGLLILGFFAFSMIGGSGNSEEGQAGAG